MEGNEPTKMIVNALEIISRLRSKIGRLYFCPEMNRLYPDEPGYDINFFFKVLMGEKIFPNYFITKMIGNPTYALYVPDNTKIKKLLRDFLLTLFAYIDPIL